MSRGNNDTLESLVARSTLVPTAGEFVPRASRPNTHPRNNNNGQPGGNGRNDSRQSTSGISSQTFHSNEFYANNREPKYFKNNGGCGRFKRNEREMVQPVSQEGRSWRDGTREGRRNDQWQTSEFQPHTSGQRSRPKDHRDGDFSNNQSSRNAGPNTSRAQYGHQNGERHGPHSMYNGEEAAGGNTPAKPPKNGYRNSPHQFKHNGPPRNYRSRVEAGKNQMEVLITQLTRGTLECLVCCDLVKQTHSTWSCRVCYHVMHLRCVVEWARASRADQGWRCPACQYVSSNTPSEYLCFCGKLVDPPYDRLDCPHSCGDTCSQARPAPCPHRCTLPCHPGPCPPCRAFVTRACGCGRVSSTVACAVTDPVACGADCGRALNCGVHQCQEKCHSGSCSPCQQAVPQECHCGCSKREVTCTRQSAGVSFFCCETKCGKKLKCGNHDCSRICHEGPCNSCELLPAAIHYCPCGKAELRDLDSAPRVTCTDSIPTCDNACGKVLTCGEPGNRHECLSKCHEGPCPACPRETMVRCRCGHMNKAVPCAELTANDVLCERKCNRRRSCGKHKCREACCIDIDHICPLPCTRTLTCGLHRCEENCHSAFCRPCARDSFEELLCECGMEVLLPPVPCGTRRPPCTRPCSRQHACEHTPTHSCHAEPECPPCTVLVAKCCHGGHELRKAVFCHLDAFSCGIACGKPMPCGRHTCVLPCHAGPCLRDGQSCAQPCTVPRASCGHGCGLPCHEPPCPDAPCKEMVKVSCECGLRYSTRACVDNARDYQRIVTVQLASKMADLAAGQTVDLNEVATSGKKMSFKTLDCTEDCKVVERNRRLAVGLQIRNPDLTAKLTPRYSELLRTWAKKDPRFCQLVHDKLTDLVQLAKQSKQKSRSYSFDSMNYEKRQFVHEYCEHFGCESVAYDQEPNRNIVATALRDKSWLPGLSLLEVIQRENGARKVPLPSNSKSKLVAMTSKPMEVLSAKASSATASAWAQPTSASTSSAAPVDYFEAQGPSANLPPQVDYFDMAPIQ